MMARTRQRAWMVVAVVDKRGGRGINIGAGECPSSFVGPNGRRLSSLWAVGPVLGRGGQSAFMGGCGGHFLSLVAFRDLWVIVCGW